MGGFTYDIASNPPSSTTDKVAAIPASKPWGDPYALDRIKQDFSFAENYRSQNHDWRWRNADELYLGWNQVKYWEGTRIPRSSLGIYVALEQVESLLPKLVSTIFSDGENWFQAAPMPSTTYEQARAVRDLLSFYLQSNHESPQERVREVFRRAAKSALIYGNGVIETGWRKYDEKRIKLVRDLRPKMRQLDLSLLGLPHSIGVPTGELESKVREIEYTDSCSEPFLRNVSLKDFYIDPNCPSPVIQEARYCILRSYMSVSDIDRLRKTYGFNIPSIEELIKCSNKKPSAQADWTKAGVEVVRTGSWNPQVDMTSDPMGKRVEVLAYWTKDRLIWVVGREYVVLNMANPYGFIPFYNWYYVDVVDRFYGLAVTDIVEGEQRLIMSIINARVDELSLSIHKPMIKRRGLQIPAYQLRRRPGQLIEAENPKEDIVMEQSQNVTQQAYIEVDAAERRVQKYTGVTDLAVLGAPGAGGNSASRTATGITTQSQASFSRIQYLVENAEDTFIEPMLSGLHQLCKKFIDPNEMMQILGDEGQQIQVDPLDVINSEVKFSMRASARMQSRNFLLQAFPLLGQTLLNPEFLQLLAQQQQMTVDIKELGMVLGDATGYRMERGFFRKITPQEQQAMNQPPPQMMMKDKMQQDKLQAQMQMKQMEGESASGQQEDQAMYDMAHTSLEKGLEAHLEPNTGGKGTARKGK